MIIPAKNLNRNSLISHQALIYFLYNFGFSNFYYFELPLFDSHNLCIRSLVSDILAKFHPITYHSKDLWKFRISSSLPRNVKESLAGDMRRHMAPGAGFILIRLNLFRGNCQLWCMAAIPATSHWNTTFHTNFTHNTWFWLNIWKKLNLKMRLWRIIASYILVTYLVFSVLKVRHSFSITQSIFFYNSGLCDF